MRRSNSPCFRICVAALLSLSAATFSLTAQAQSSNPLTEAQALLQKGQQSQALERVDRALAANPKDRQARFLKGVILAEMNKLDEAASVFVKLTEDAPELPEPYNNLAVIYAQQKHFDKAKSALEMAIRTHPSYAVAHENLGDLYSKMARQAYDRALQIDSNNSNAQAKLNLLRDLTTTANARPVAPPRTVTVAAATPTPTTVTPAAPVPPVATPPAARASAPVPVIPATTASAPPVVKPAIQPPANPVISDESRTAVRAAVQAWADAWSKKNVREYLSFYAPDFQVPNRKSRKAWEAERTQRVSKPGAIKVSLSEIQIDIKGDEATVRFKQNYDSASFKSASGKTLVMTQRNGRWQIRQERIGR